MRLHVVPVAVVILLVVMVTAMTSPTPIAASPKDSETRSTDDASATHTSGVNKSSTAASSDMRLSGTLSSILSPKDASKSATAKLLTKLSPPPRAQRKARTVMSSYNYPVVRNGRCATNLEYYGHCYLCGRMADVPRIYYECCLEDVNVRTFCEAMLT
jgi:hypothetical protein